MNKWVAEFELEDGDTMPEHMDLEYKGMKIDFHCRPKEPTNLDKIRAEIELHRRKTASIDPYDLVGDCLEIIDQYKSENKE